MGIDATTLEANAAMRSIVRRDSGEGYEEFLRRLAQESGIATPMREQLAKLDRKRAQKGSNEDWVNPHDPEAGITKLKDGRTHLAYKAVVTAQSRFFLEQRDLRRHEPNRSNWRRNLRNVGGLPAQRETWKSSAAQRKGYGEDYMQGLQH